MAHSSLTSVEAKRFSRAMARGNQAPKPCDLCRKEPSTQCSLWVFDASKDGVPVNFCDACKKDPFYIGRPNQMLEHRRKPKHEQDELLFREVRQP